MLSIKEFCEKNHMSRSTYFKLTLKGMPIVKVKRRVWIIETDAIEWMKKNSPSYTNG